MPAIAAISGQQLMWAILTRAERMFALSLVSVYSKGLFIVWSGYQPEFWHQPNPFCASCLFLCGVVTCLDLDSCRDSDPLILLNKLIWVALMHLRPLSQRTLTGPFLDVFISDFFFLILCQTTLISPCTTFPPIIPFLLIKNIFKLFSYPWLVVRKHCQTFSRNNRIDTEIIVNVNHKNMIIQIGAII